MTNYLKRPWVIVASDFAKHGGMDRANYELARFIAERGKGPLHLVAHHVSEPLAQMPEVVVHLASRPAGKDFLGRLLLARVGRSVANQLNAANPRVIVNGGNCRASGVNWVHYVHRSYRAKNRGIPILYRIKNWIEGRSSVRAERKAFARSRLIIANSKRTATDVLQVVDNDRTDRIQVVYLGIDDACYSIASEAERSEARGRLGLQAAAKIVLFLGGLGFDQRKGFDTLVAAFGQLSRIRGDAELFAVGGGRLNYWKRRIAGQTNIRLVGPRQDVPDWLAAADLLVSPTRYEAFGMAVQEALCRGLPAIVSRAAGVAERYPRELGELLLPDAEDAADLTRRMEMVLSDPHRFRPAVRELGDSLRKWTWTDMSAEMVRLIEAGV